MHILHNDTHLFTEYLLIHLRVVLFVGLGRNDEVEETELPREVDFELVEQ